MKIIHSKKIFIQVKNGLSPRASRVRSSSFIASDNCHLQIWISACLWKQIWISSKNSWYELQKNLPLGNQAQLRKTTTTRSNIELMAFILTHDIWITTTNRNQLYCDCSWCAFSGYCFCCLYGHSAHIETACFHCEHFSCVCPVCARETEFCDISHIPLLLLHYMQPFHMSHVLESNFLALVDFTNAGEATTTLLTVTESSLTMLDTWLSVFSANIFGSNLFLDVFLLPRYIMMVLELRTIFLMSTLASYLSWFSFLSPQFCLVADKCQGEKSRNTPPPSCHQLLFQIWVLDFYKHPKNILKTFMCQI